MSQDSLIVKDLFGRFMVLEQVWIESYRIILMIDYKHWMSKLFSKVAFHSKQPPTMSKQQKSFELKQKGGWNRNLTGWQIGQNFQIICFLKNGKSSVFSNFDLVAGKWRGCLKERKKERCQGCLFLFEQDILKRWRTSRTNEGWREALENFEL